MAPGDRPQPWSGADRSEDRCTRSGRGRHVVAVALAVGLALAWLGTHPPAAPPPRPATTAAAPTLHELTGLDDPVVLAVTTPGDRCCQLLRWSPDGPTPEAVATVELSDPAFDRSGRWVAGLRADPISGGGAVLWAGAVPGPLEPVAVGVDGFAWHDRHAGALAWSRTVAGSGELAVLVTGGASSRWAASAPAGSAVQAWGGWGFAVGLAGSHDTTLLDAGGTVVAERHRGFVAGRAPGLGWLTTRLDHPPGPVSVLAEVGQATRPLTAGRFAELASSLAVGPDGRYTAVHLARGRPGALLDGGRVVVLDHTGRTVHQVTAVAGGEGLAWTADAERLVAVRAGGGSSVQLAVWHARTGTERVVAVPGLDAGHAHVAAVAVQRR